MKNCGYTLFWRDSDNVECETTAHVDALDKKLKKKKKITFHNRDACTSGNDYIPFKTQNTNYLSIFECTGYCDVSAHI